MFSPREGGLVRGWPGRIEGDRVIQLAAQTLQAYFTGGGVAREHAEYAFDDVVLRAPVLQPPSIRIFGRDGDFHFANPAAIHGPDDVVHVPVGASGIVPVARLAAIVGAAGTIGGYTLMNDWEAPELTGTQGDRLRDIPRADRHHATTNSERTLSTSRRLRIVPPRTRSSSPAI